MTPLEKAKSLCGKPMPFYTYCSHKACLRYEEKGGLQE